MSKRKTGALRKKHEPFRHKGDSDKTFYTDTSKTIKSIDFSKYRKKQQSRRPIELIPQSINQEKYITQISLKPISLWSLAQLEQVKPT